MEGSTVRQRSDDGTVFCFILFTGCVFILPTHLHTAPFFPHSHLHHTSCTVSSPSPLQQAHLLTFRTTVPLRFQRRAYFRPTHPLPTYIRYRKKKISWISWYFPCLIPHPHPSSIIPPFLCYNLWLFLFFSLFWRSSCPRRCHPLFSCLVRYPGESKYWIRRRWTDVAAVTLTYQVWHTWIYLNWIDWMPDSY